MVFLYMKFFHYIGYINAIGHTVPLIFLQGGDYSTTTNDVPSSILLTILATLYTDLCHIISKQYHALYVVYVALMRIMLYM